ncbi:zinc finger, CCHC-type containing protein [Tanacetum coccineum]
MVVTAMKHMASNFAKLDKFEGVDFRRWQKKMHFLLSSMSVVYVLTTPISDDGGDDPTVEQVRKRAKWDNDDYDSDKPKSNNVVGPSVVNMVEHNNSSRYNDNKGTTVHVCKDRCWFKTYESVNDGSIHHMGNKLNALVRERGCVDLKFSSGKIISLFNVLHVLNIRKNLVSSRLSQGFWGKAMLIACYLLNRVPNKRNMITHYELWTKHPKLKTLGEKGIKCIFVPYAENFKAFRDEVSDQQSYCFNVKDDPKIFDEAMKSHDVAFWKETINDEMDSIMGNNTWVLADLPPGCKWIFKRKLNVDGTIEKFKARLVIQGIKQKSRINYFDTYAPVTHISTIRLLIAMTSIHNLIIHQMDVKTTFLNGDLDEEVYMNQPQGFIMPGNENKVYKLINKFDESGKGVIICLYVDDLLIFGTDQVQLDLTKEFLSSKFSMKDMREADVIYSRVIGCLMYAMTCTRPDIAFVVGKLSSKTEDNSSTSGWVFVLGGGAISWAFKKQTCITGSIMEYEFVALEAAGKEAKWLKNLLLEIPLWSKPIAPISIRCDSAATLVKAYSQTYIGKSKHIGVRSSMIRELITNGVISIEFARSQQNLAYHLTKGLDRDLVIKSAKGMGLKSY